MDKTDIYSIIRRKDRLNQFTDPDIISVVDEIEQVVRNYCGINNVPDALRYTIANMSIDLLNYEIETAKVPADIGIESLDISDVSGIKIGDTDIAFGGIRQSGIRKTILNSHKSNLDAIVMNYTRQLNQFRRIL